MKRSIFKPIIIGILAGAALFFFGFFVLRFLLFFLLIGAIVRFFVWRSFRRRFYYRNFYHAHQHVNNMYDSNVIHLRTRNDRDISID